MKHARIGLYIASALSFFAVTIPHVVFGATDTSKFFPIIPQSGSCLCIGSAPDWGCILQVLQNVISAAVFMGVILCVIWIAYGGFSMMISGGSPEARSQAKTRLLNAVVGIAVILCSWIIVDFVMKVVYNPSTAFEGNNFGPWNSILASSGLDLCIKVNANPTPLVSGTPLGLLLGSSPSGGAAASTGAVGAAGPLCPAGSGCSVETLQAAGLNIAQAQALSCIAMTESSGIPTQVNPSSKACGLFQITNETSKSNWQNPANHGPGCSVSTSCTNATCNLQTALIMYKKSGYQPWTCAGCNNKAAACVAKYDPGH